MDKKQLKQYYNDKAKRIDELASTYENKIPYKRFFFLSRFKKVTASLNPRKKENILDIGCGPGYYSKFLASKGCNVTALDISSEYINQAKAYTRAKVIYITCNATKLPFKNDTFDKVLMTEVIEHIPNYIKALRELKRVLKPSGIAVITTPNKYSYMNFAYALKRIIRRYKLNEHVKEFSRDEFINLLSQFFDIEDFTLTNYLVPYPIDYLFLNIRSRGVYKALENFENMLSKTQLTSSIGWTMIATVKNRKDK